MGEMIHLNKFKSFFKTNKRKVLFQVIIIQLFIHGKVKVLLGGMSCNVLFEHWGCMIMKTHCWISHNSQ